RTISYPGTEVPVAAAAAAPVGASVTLPELAGGGGRVTASLGTDGGMVGKSATSAAGGTAAVSDCAWGLREGGWPRVAIGDLPGDTRALPRRGRGKGNAHGAETPLYLPGTGGTTTIPGRTRERRLGRSGLTRQPPGEAVSGRPRRGPVGGPLQPHRCQ